MHKASFKDFLLLFLLAGIWGSAFFNIKIASESYTPMALAFGRIFFAAIVMLVYCWIRKISIEAFGENWLWYATIGFVNLVLPFFFISFGILKVQSNLAAILMGFLGIVYLFSDNILINQSNIFYAFMVILGPVCYTIGGLFSLKLKHIKNEVLTSSILIWAVILLLPIMFIFENPTELRPSLNATISLLYLGIVATAIAWLMRFYILKNNGLVFQSQVAYIIPIFGLIFGYLFLNEKITYKIIVALIAVLISTYLIEKSKKNKITDKLS